MKRLSNDRTAKTAASAPPFPGDRPRSRSRHRVLVDGLPEAADPTAAGGETLGRTLGLNTEVGEEGETFRRTPGLNTEVGEQGETLGRTPGLNTEDA
jgi:hypothetical protein